MRCIRLISLLLIVFLGNGCDVEEVDLPETTNPLVFWTNDLVVIMDENPRNNSLLGNIQGYSEKQFLYSYSLEASNPEGALRIDKLTGVLQVQDSTFFDFELYPSITAKVKVEADNTAVFANIGIELKDVYESVLKAEGFEIALAENPYAQTYLGQIEATTTDGALTYELLKESHPGSIDLSPTGEVIVLDNSLYDFEANPKLTATIKVSNGVVSKQVQVVIYLTDVDEPDAVYSIGFRGFSDHNFCNQGPDNSSYFYIETTSSDGFFQAAEWFAGNGVEIAQSFDQITGNEIKIDLSIPPFDPEYIELTLGTHLEGIFFTVYKDQKELMTISAEELFICTDTQHRLVLTYNTQNDTYDIIYDQYGF
ncbi:cadherin repeat domain-containing protein [Leeuwenhoekiella polynyae]|uniref:Cadherin domain-containing protein n=1 Tax=Leeuwenhoekiella polynyae TaxID=1550906 RepID=A0A4Q0PID5_9FLAO|nr:cadherin repeat domain-containing protein [Leeuwenhoekiella polynyae]RXG26041.1 hypothetical protein DSM02_32 [Leeuwenhoekiella polynyae]